MQTASMLFIAMFTVLPYRLLCTAFIPNNIINVSRDKVVEELLEYTINILLKYTRSVR